MIRTVLVITAIAPVLFFGCAREAAKPEPDAFAVRAQYEQELRSVEALVASQLLDSASAKFRETRRFRSAPDTFCGEVNARNSFGGMTGWKTFAVDPEKQVSVLDENRANLAEFERLCSANLWSDTTPDAPPPQSPMRQQTGPARAGSR